MAAPALSDGLEAVTRGSASGNIFALQEKARLQSSGPSLSGRTFVIDSAPTLPMTDDTQLVAEHTSNSYDYSMDIAQRISGRLAAVGASPFVLDADERAAPDLLDFARIHSHQCVEHASARISVRMGLQPSISV